MAMLNIISRSTAASCICPQDFSTCRTEWFVTYFNINKCLWHARVLSIYTFCFVRKAGQCRVFMTLSNISTADSVDASIHVFVWGSDFGFALSFASLVLIVWCAIPTFEDIFGDFSYVVC